MEIDEALERAKPVGRIHCLLLMTTGIFATELAFVALGLVFITEVPSHHCTVCNNCTLEESIPVQGDDPLLFEQCVKYVNPEWKNETEVCSKGWQYDTELYGKSIVSDWDLVCDKDSLPGLSLSITAVGVAIGSILAGAAADKYGRRPVTIASLLLFNIVGIAVSFSPNYATFVTLRFLLGALLRGIHLPPLTTLFEFLIPKHRAVFGSIPGVIFTLALMLMSGIAYWIRDWRIFHAVLMVPSIAALTFIWFQPESVRWLSSQGNHKTAEKWMQKIAKFNGVKDYPNPALKHSGTEDQNKVSKENGNNKKKARTTILLELFRPPTLLVTCILSWLWVAYSLLYFGFALTTGTLAGNFYLNFFLSSLVELPGRIIPMFIIKRTGGLKPLIVTLIACGLCITTIVITDNLTDNEWLVTTLSLVGKFLTINSLVSINLLTAELFPTKERTAGTGITGLIGNLGSIASPVLIYLDKFVPNLTSITMIAATFLSAFLCLFLPETKGAIQPDTREDLQTLLKTKRILSCRCGKDTSEGSNTSHGGNLSLKSETTPVTIEKGQENIASEREDEGLKSETVSGIMNGGYENIAFEGESQSPKSETVTEVDGGQEERRL